MEYVESTSILQTGTVCISAIVAVISLVLSIIGLIRQKPKLKILIPDPEQDCFYGWKQLGDSDKYARVAYVRICLINNSPVAIGVEDITMRLKGKKLSRVRSDNKYWDDTTLFYRTEDKLVDPGTGLYYSNEALKFPTKVEAYNTASGIVLFYNFPNSINGDCKAEILMRTAIGVIKKRIRVREYNEKIIDAAYRNFVDYNDSIERFSS